jgi:hypothetical protein
MTHPGFNPCLVDLEHWMLASICPSDGHEYYAYVLIYIDNVLVVHHAAKNILLCIDKYFQLKPGSIGDPDIYPGVTIKKMYLLNGVEAWASSPLKYV